MALIKTVNGTGALSGEFKHGDIIGFSGRSLCSTIINIGTYGVPLLGISHVGIIGSYDKRLVMFESMMNTDMKCLVQGKMVQGTQAHDIEESIRKYRGKVWHYPLYRFLPPQKRNQLNGFLLEHIGTDYDSIGAIRAGGVLFSWFESKIRRQDLSKIFCSEYCAAAHQRIEVLGTNHASKWNPNRLVRVERRLGVLRQPVRLK